MLIVFIFLFCSFELKNASNKNLDFGKYRTAKLEKTKASFQGGFNFNPMQMVGQQGQQDGETMCKMHLDWQSCDADPRCCYEAEDSECGALADHQKDCLPPGVRPPQPPQLIQNLISGATGLPSIPNGFNGMPGMPGGMQRPMSPKDAAKYCETKYMMNPKGCAMDPLCEWEMKRNGGGDCDNAERPEFGGRLDKEDLMEQVIQSNIASGKISGFDVNAAASTLFSQIQEMQRGLSGGVFPVNPAPAGNAAVPAGTGPVITVPITGTETDFEHPSTDFDHPEGPVINPCIGQSPNTCEQTQLPSPLLTCKFVGTACKLQLKAEAAALIPQIASQMESQPPFTNGGQPQIQPALPQSPQPATTFDKLFPPVPPQQQPSQPQAFPAQPQPQPPHPVFGHYPGGHPSMDYEHPETDFEHKPMEYDHPETDYEHKPMEFDSHPFNDYEHPSNDFEHKPMEYDNHPMNDYEHPSNDFEHKSMDFDHPLDNDNFHQPFQPQVFPPQPQTFPQQPSQPSAQMESQSQSFLTPPQQQPQNQNFPPPQQQNQQPPPIQQQPLPGPQMQQQPQNQNFLPPQQQNQQPQQQQQPQPIQQQPPPGQQMQQQPQNQNYPPPQQQNQQQQNQQQNFPPQQNQNFPPSQNQPSTNNAGSALSPSPQNSNVFNSSPSSQQQNQAPQSYQQPQQPSTPPQQAQNFPPSQNSPPTNNAGSPPSTNSEVFNSPPSQQQNQPSQAYQQPNYPNDPSPAGMMPGYPNNNVPSQPSSQYNNNQPASNNGPYELYLQKQHKSQEEQIVLTKSLQHPEENKSFDISNLIHFAMAGFFGGFIFAIVIFYGCRCNQKNNNELTFDEKFIILDSEDGHINLDNRV